MGAVRKHEKVGYIQEFVMLSLYLSVSGIGDAICGIYAACGAANSLLSKGSNTNHEQNVIHNALSFHDVESSEPVHSDAESLDVTMDSASPAISESPGIVIRFHTQHAAWLERVSHPGVEIGNFEGGGGPGWIDMGNDYQGQLKLATSRKQWYCNQIRTGMTPCRPAVVNSSIKQYALERGPYVVLAPFSNWAPRHWPISHWKYLIALLHDIGLYCVILDGPGDGSRLRDAFKLLSSDWAMWVWGNSPDWIADIMLKAQVVIGIDSGLTHFAGLLNVPTVAIMSHLPPDLVFSHTQINAITPHNSCVYCRWQPERGYRFVCDSACSAIASVLPEHVLSLVQKLSVEYKSPPEYKS